MFRFAQHDRKQGGVSQLGDWKFFGALELGIWSFRLQPDGMPRVETTRRPISGLPARRPFAGVTIVRRGIESKSGNDGEGVTLACVNGDPFASAALAVAAKLG